MEFVNKVSVDGNEAAAYIAHKLNEVIAIYPITPSSPMGEFADEWSAHGVANLWNSIPTIVEMQSEAGAAGAIHGALQAGALTSTFTASQGLLLMIPNMYKIAGELTPAVFHVAARSLAAQALSIFCDHSDVMATRGTGFAILSSNSVQEVMDMALIAQAATLKGRIPIVHFFDGFRTSHEVNTIDKLSDEQLAQMIDDECITRHRQRALSPEHPVIRGTSQNPDVYFQARETVNPFYNDFPNIVQNVMRQFAELTGRHYNLFDYFGSTDALHVIVIMGSGAETVHETVEYMQQHGEKVGVIKVRLYRPFSPDHFINALPLSVKSIAVLDRTKEPGADGEPLFKDIVNAITHNYLSNDAKFTTIPMMIGGRYGLSSKEFTPGMVKGIYDELKKPDPKRSFTVGIIDDVGNTHLPWNEEYRTDAHKDTFQAVFYGLGSDGTVSANKNSIKIIGEETELHAQGYFVYDSKKSGAVTVSHLRFGDKPIRSTYLIEANEARFIACHQPVFLERFDLLEKAARNAVFLLNSQHSADTIWNNLPKRLQKQIVEKNITFYTVDAYAVAKNTGMGKRINTIMQTCFFAISGILPQEQAIAAIKHAVEKTYGKKGKRIVEFNFKAIDETLQSLHKIDYHGDIKGHDLDLPSVPDTAPDFVKQVTWEIIAGRGDRIPVSKMPVDGTFPLGTAAYEKRNLALEIPVWESDLCTHCGKCPFVCPHGVIRSKVFPAELTVDAPATFKQVPVLGKDFPRGLNIAYQVSPEDCTGCGLCVEICPIRDKSNVGRKALNMVDYAPLRQQEMENWNYFLSLPEYDRRQVKPTTMKGSMLYHPLFEFSSACEGCGETPYIKLASQLFGDRMIVANATGCSSIYGGNLPTTPWTVNAQGRGPAWNNSLFEDNAEFGLGIRTALDKQKEYAQEILHRLKKDIGEDLVEAIINANEEDESGIHEQRERIVQLQNKLQAIDSPWAKRLQSLADTLCKKSVWIIGGDGWAYDIGFGGLDHVLASGSNVNILVLDTEVYSNTGGQTSKATPRGAVAKFSSGGKPTGKKDLARIAMSYENVYVAHVAYAAKDVQTLRTFIEAEHYPGPSLIIAYSPCIAHGVDLKNNHRQQELAVKSGHWPLFRFDPTRANKGQNPLHLDSKAPSIAYKEFTQTETRFSMLWRSDPQAAERLCHLAQEEVNERYQRYAQHAELSWDILDQPPSKSNGDKNSENKE